MLYSIPYVPTTIYLSCGMLAGYECLLFLLAVQAGIRHSRGKFALGFWNGRRLVDVIVKGNVAYFFM